MLEDQTELWGVAFAYLALRGGISPVLQQEMNDLQVALVGSSVESGPVLLPNRVLIGPAPQRPKRFETLGQCDMSCHAGSYRCGRLHIGTTGQEELDEVDVPLISCEVERGTAVLRAKKDVLSHSALPLRGF